MNDAATDTIAAIATAAGAAGVGVLRISGPQAKAIGETLCARALPVREAVYVRFRDAHGETLDDGIALYFAAPASFTGEDVVELQGHGSPVLLQQLLQTVITRGARMARAGEFSERAFHNGKLDLAQAEAVADLIAASDVAAARAARRSLDGVFSRRVDALVEEVTLLRVQCEAAIDFADEPLETLGDERLRARLATIRSDFEQLLREAERGQRLRDGLHAVIVGPPNVGKSSLLNALAGSDRAIVTDIAGTTRDVLREAVRIGGMEITLVDTAGLRETGDVVEREGIRRARDELQRADLALMVLDARDPQASRDDLAIAVADVPVVIEIHNKADLAGGAFEDASFIRVSAHSGEGLDALRRRIIELSGQGESTEGAFSARARHVDALRRAGDWLQQADAELSASQGELAAEALRLTQEALGEITGRLLPDALLGRIFSTFCIGK